MEPHDDNESHESNTLVDSEESNDEDSENIKVSTEPQKALSAREEREIMDYVEEQFLEITRAFKKRNLDNAKLPTLESYLFATHPMLTVILELPPVIPQATLRTSLLLRLSNEILTSVIGYAPDPAQLPLLILWLDELDRGWVAVLRSQVWDAEERTGVKAILAPGARLPATAMSQTDRARLRSILLQASGEFETWLDNLKLEGAADLGEALERLGLSQQFNDMFFNTLNEMGELH